MADRLPRCRTCPRCGSRTFRRVAKNFLPGTWRQCLDCREQYRPPVSLLVSLTAILFGSFMLLTGGASLGIGGQAMLTLIFAGVGAAFSMWGIWQVVRWARTPVGPLAAFAIETASPSAYLEEEALRSGHRPTR